MAPDLDLDPLLVETLALVVSRDHALACETSIGLETLSAESLVLLSAEFATRDQIDRFCRQHGIQPRVRIEANSISAVVEIVRRTRLSTLLPATIAFAHQDLIAIALDPVRLQRTAVLMQRKDAYRSAAAKIFVALAKEVAAGFEGFQGV
jgi:LysR family cyn operon transcriptional activator